MSKMGTPKMKQATLFSLTSWKKVAVEEIIKYKKILDKKDVTEVVILRTLLSLKKTNPRKDSVLSTGIDSSLKLLANHPSSSISTEVKMLLKHWKIENSSEYSNTIEACKENLPSKTNFELDIKIEKVVDVISKGSETLSVTNVQSDLSIAKIQPTKELCLTKVSTELEKTNKEICKKPSLAQSFKTQSLKPVTKMQTPKQICKKESINQVQRRDIFRRLQSAIQLFMEEIGKQEVTLYLEEQA